MIHHSVRYGVPMDVEPVHRPTAIASEGAARLVEAGWQVIDDLPLARSFAGATSAQVATAAGVTTGSFFHHFANASEFADALALSLLEDDPPMPEALPELLAALDEVAVTQLLRSAMNDLWSGARSDSATRAEFRNEMALWARHRHPLGTPRGDLSTVADVLCQRYRAREEAPLAVWSALLDTVGRSTAEPFTTNRIATAITALWQGLALRQAVDPDAVDDELFGDLVGLLVISLSRARRAVPQSPDQRFDPIGSPQARSGQRRRRQTRQRILDAVQGAFADGWEPISASDLADRAGVSVQTISNQFHSVRALAASTFAVHLADVETAAGQIDDRGSDPAGPTDSTGPTDSLRAALVELAEAAASDPHAARALLDERLLASLTRGDHVSPVDIRAEVPLGPTIAAEVERILGDRIGPSRAAEVADTIADFVLGHAVSHPGRATDTAELALRLLPDTTGSSPAGVASGRQD